MSQSESLFTWKKGEKIQLNKYFNTNELSCRCNHPECVDQFISKDLIERLTKVREELNKALIITSAFRCHKYQEDLRSMGANTVVAKKSQHELGNAVDCIPKNGTVSELMPIAEKHFKAIGIAKTFLHLDMRDDKVRRWPY